VDVSDTGRAATLHALARIYVGTREADQLRATDPAGYQQLIDRVREVGRAWWASKGRT
jgi:hypothetical protein